MIEKLNEGNKNKFIQFLSENWSQNHIYVRDINYLNYEISDQSNFLLWLDGDKIVASLGYLAYDDDGDIFTIVWKNIGSMNTGITLLQHLLSAGFRSISSCGISKNTIPIYQFLNIPTGRLKHFYRLNPNIDFFGIAKIEKRHKDIIDTDGGVVNLCHCFSIEELLSKVDYQQFKQQGFYKSPAYFNKRYFKHPYYQYNVLCKKESVLVYRIVCVGDRQCIRIIDFLGNEKDFNEYASYLFSLMLKEGYEYTDIYQVGLNDETLLQSGFVERLENDVNIIPNYFEPFVQENKEIYFMSNYNGRIKMFKGDGDQDRPSIRKIGDKRYE